jgi:hypothetical protein
VGFIVIVAFVVVINVVGKGLIICKGLVVVVVGNGRIVRVIPLGKCKRLVNAVVVIGVLIVIGSNVVVLC